MPPARAEVDEECWSAATRESLSGKRVTPLFGPAMPWSRRLKRVVVCFCVIGMVGAFVVPGQRGSPFSGRTHLGAQASAARTRVSLAPCATCFYFDPSIPWARVSLDGRPIAAPQLGDPAPLMLRSGVHTLSWQADPAPAQSCQLSVPSAPDDTCRLASFTIEYAAGKPPALVVLLPGDPSQVSPDQRGGVLSTMRHALQQQEIMQSGQDPNG